MATDVIKGYHHLQQELNRARDNLKGLNDNIRKIIGRDPSTTEQYTSGNSFGAYSRNEARKRNSSGFDAGNRRGVEQQEGRFSDGGLQNPVKRRAIGETKSVFSRLSGPPSRDTEYAKPRIHSRVIKEQPTRQEIVAAQGSDERSRARNRRIFGSLLGTLQKFSQEESKLKYKEQKKAQIEKKLEEQQKNERENLRKEKQCLFTDRKRQQLEIRTIETKMAKMKDLETWEELKKPLACFIKTKAGPPIYYLPKKMDPKMSKKLMESQDEHARMMDTKRQEVLDSIAAVEARFRADIKSLEENANRNKSMSAAEADNLNNSSKHDRTTAADEDDDFQDDDRPANDLYHHHDKEQFEVAEGPTLPSSLSAQNFKITFQNQEAETQEKSEVSLPNTVRHFEVVTSSLNAEAAPVTYHEKASFLTQGENFRITFNTTSQCDSE